MNKAIKAQALENLKGNWLVTIFSYIVPFIVSGIAIGIITLLGRFLDAVLKTTLFTPIFIVFGEILNVVLYCAIISGWQQMFLDLADHKEIEFKTIISRTDIIIPYSVMMLVIIIKICLWSLLCGIPGIVALYRYSMAPYILLENPTISAFDAIEYSKDMTYGHKMELFKLSLSFIGWLFLGTLACGIGIYAVLPYMQESYAIYYKTLSYNYIQAQNAYGDNR